MSCLGLGIGLIYATQGGLNWLDFVDSNITNGPFGILLVGLFQCLVIGWIYDIKKLRRHANRHSDWKLGVWWEWLIRVVIPLILGSLIVWSFYDYYGKFKVGEYLRDVDGQWIFKDIWGVVMMMVILLAAILLALWRRNGEEVNHAG